MKRAPSIEQGFTLIELIIFIVVISLSLAGILLVINKTTQHSVDPQIRKQALLIAESLMEEIQLQPFTWCDADDPNVETATSTANCTTVPNAIGPEGGEARGAGFDHVDDYHGYTSTGARNALNQPIVGLEAYNTAVNISAVALGSVPATDALRIRVTVTHPEITIVLEGWRTRYAPNAGP